MNVQDPEFRCALGTAMEQWGIELPDTALDQMELHYRAMVEANKAVNLTRITDPLEAAIKHYADSLAILLWIRERQINVTSVIDVGTGAGFPAVPLAIMRPAWKVTAIDGTAKKAAFVRQVSRELHLANVTVVHAHSTHWSNASKADLVLVRAVGRLSKCVHQTAEYVRPGGFLVAFKTSLAEDDAELAEAREACSECRMKMTPPYLYELGLRGDSIERALYALQK